jgi:hypothetical protein
METTKIITDEEILYPADELSNKISFTLSFNKFLDKLKSKLENNIQKTDLDDHWLHELKKHKEWLNGAHITDYSSYRPFFEFIQHSSFAPIQGKDLMWGLIQPVYPYCIYGTPALSGLLEQDLQVRLKPGVYINSQESSQLIWKIVFYSFVLQKLYDYSMNDSVGIVTRIGDMDTELTRYFRFEIDTSYLEVTVAEQLPQLKIEEIFEYDAKGILFDYLGEALPLEIFSVTGFASVKVIKDTTHSILEEIRAAIINQTTDSIVETTKMVLKMLKSLVQSGTIRFGLLPILKLNGKLINFDVARQLSIVLNTSYAQTISNQEILNQLEKFNKDPKLVIVDKRSVADNNLLRGVFEKENFQTIALLPIYHQSLLVGHLEIATNNDCELAKQINVFALEQAMPFLAELVYRDNMEFNNQISQIVQAKFTSIHPSVLWKMNEAAFVYLKDVISKPQQALISDIVFEKVFPFYGIVDIRNSTAIRNKAIQDDITSQLHALMATLREINNELDLKIVDAKLAACYNWLEVLKKSCTAEIELNIYSFIETEITPLLNYYCQNFPRVRKSIMRYYETIDPETGSSGKNRRVIERSMNIINNSINSQIETFGNRLQRCYPSYFDSFRTDGVEYNIYLGQAIAPYKTFDDHYLYEYRLLQLISMAEIARTTYSLLPQMEEPLQTTQLIFTSNRPIDISFRSDEKRFDVEGSHNIRYQMIKKRIDKVYIKGTNERLTQPGKIAIVYLDAEIRQEYDKYVLYGQQQGYFKEKVEYLDLEELQDVSGLKAIRVGIKL